jgi:hypothetical protein
VLIIVSNNDPLPPLPTSPSQPSPPLPPPPLTCSVTLTPVVVVADHDNHNTATPGDVSNKCPPPGPLHLQCDAHPVVADAPVLVVVAADALIRVGRTSHCTACS